MFSQVFLLTQEVYRFRGNAKHAQETLLTVQAHGKSVERDWSELGFWVFGRPSRKVCSMHAFVAVSPNLPTSNARGAQVPCARCHMFLCSLCSICESWHGTTGTGVALWRQK